MLCALFMPEIPVNLGIKCLLHKFGDKNSSLVILENLHLL